MGRVCRKDRTCVEGLRWGLSSPASPLTPPETTGAGVLHSEGLAKAKQCRFLQSLRKIIKHEENNPEGQP